MTKAVLIFGATGKQGGAVVNALIDADADYEILAVTRDTKSASAQRLVQKSPKIKLVQGNMDNPAEIFQDAKKATSLPIWGVFSVQTPVGGVEREEQQGKALIDESIKAGVKTFVYSSVDRGGDASFDNPTDVPHFITKHHIEHHLIDATKSGEMDWTIFRPVAFFDNFIPGFVGKAFVTTWKITLEGKPLQLIATSDIGFVGGQALLKPEEYKGKCISLAGDELTYDQFAQVFKEKTGNELATTWEFICRLFLYFVKDVGFMFRWFRDQGYGADIPALKKIHPELKDFGTWLEQDSAFIKKR